MTGLTSQFCVKAEEAQEFIDACMKEAEKENDSQAKE